MTDAFVGAFEAAVRLAKGENAMIMPAFLARVPMDLPLDAPARTQSKFGMPLIEAIEQRVASQGIEGRLAHRPGRSYRDALRHLLKQETFDRVIVFASRTPHAGLSRDDLEWLPCRISRWLLPANAGNTPKPGAFRM